MIAGEDGEMEYVFDGSDDDLEMGEIEIGDSEFLDGDGEETDFLERDRDGDESDEGNEDSESMGDDGEGMCTDDESDGDARRGRVCSGGVVSQYGVVHRQRSRSRGARGRGKRVGRGGRGRGVAVRGRPQLQDRVWTTSGTPVDIAPFIQVVGPNFAVLDDPVGIFRKLFTPELLQHIVTEMNHFASQCLSTSEEEGSSSWETSSEELEAFIGFTILMGIVRLPHLYDYWSSNEVLHCFPVASRITRKRFLDLRRFLHFVDNEMLPVRGEEGYDRLGKVRPVIEAIRHSFLSSYSPHQQCAIDEAMVPFKGRSSLKQYLPKKPIKRGFKVWVRADSVSGYVCDLDVYTGKDDTTTSHLGLKVVERLSRALVGGHFHLYFDNFFSSLPLFDSLLSDGLYACGTFRKDRQGIPEEIKSVKPGELCTIPSYM